jgi:hypothetical protein
MLKNLKSIDMWIGEKTHHLLSDYLKLMKKKSDSFENIQKLKQDVAEVMEREFEISQSRDYAA